MSAHNLHTTWQKLSWRHRIRGTEGVLVASCLIVGLLTLIAIISLAAQTDPRLTPLRRAAGLLITLSTASAFLILQGALVRGNRNRRLQHISWGLIALGVINVDLSFSWTMLGISTATTLLVLRHGARRYAAAAAVMALGTGGLFLEPNTTTARVGIPIVSLLVAFVLQTLTQLAQALIEVRLSQEEIARLRVDDERERISRDLHDLIGRTLVATSLRQQAALHLLDRDIDKARAQIESAHEAIANGQAQLRNLTQGPVSIGLDHELAATHALCQRLGIDFDERIERPIPPLVDQWTARLLREAITNMLKHSNPRHCHLCVTLQPPHAQITIENDGCPPGPPNPGTGLEHLRRQLHTIGATLTAGATGDGRYRLVSDLTTPEAEDNPS